MDTLFILFVALMLLLCPMGVLLFIELYIFFYIFMFIVFLPLAITLVILGLICQNCNK